ncbi:Hypothetical predicted protein [Paramuricea clavata]|uniref:Uncharacterized protein n=1 Tax=Paramuricea clavata TaxID=317549 RepID=A0A6S7HJ69_PARCT|nr:Hypothetical predicted protein [Paramuricea clavata]
MTNNCVSNEEIFSSSSIYKYFTPEDRVQFLKPLQEINDLEDDSDEIYASGLIKRYTKRPAKLENVSLADWAAWYNSTDSDENYDLTASGTQNIERQDEDEGAQDHPEFNENYDLSGDLGIPSAASNTEHLLILHEQQDDVYRGMVQKLNREQKEFFFHVLHLIKTSDNPFYCFLSGGAGVGKSISLSVFIKQH